VDLFFIDGGVTWTDKERDLATTTKTGDCPQDYLPHLVDNEIQVGVCTPCAINRSLDETKVFNF